MDRSEQNLEKIPNDNEVRKSQNRRLKLKNEGSSPTMSGNTSLFLKNVKSMVQINDCYGSRAPSLTAEDRCCFCSFFCNAFAKFPSS